MVNQPLTLLVATLLANDVDPDGDPLTLASVSTLSTNGGGVSLAGTNVTYSPRTNYTGYDHFGYTVSDLRGGSANGTVEVFVASGPLPPANHASVSIEPGSVQLQFSGLPGRTYEVQRSTDLLNWTVLQTIAVPAHGILNFNDVLPPLAGAFYRTRLVP